MVTATSRSRRSRIPDFCSKIKTPERSSEETSNRFEVGLEPVHALPAYFRTAARLLTGGRRELRSQLRVITTRSVPPALPHASRLCGSFLGDQNNARGSDAWRLTIPTAAATKISPQSIGHTFSWRRHAPPHDERRGFGSGRSIELQQPHPLSSIVEALF